MTTKRQIKANKKNALNGGVKTTEGKEVSKMNALKYGFFSKITTEYDKLDNEEFCKEFYNHFNPSNIYEAQLVEMLLSYTLTFRRICLIEKEYVETKLHPHIGIDFDHYIERGYDPIIKLDLIDELTKFQKYKSSIVNCIRKIQHEIERLQFNNKSPVKSIPNAIDIEVTTTSGFVLGT